MKPVCVNYPNGMQRLNNKKTTFAAKQPSSSHGKRGMALEEEINQSNQYYLSRNIAVVHKKPTPVQVVKVDYPQRSAARITEAYFRHASTTDYNGVYRGYYLDFEAKETRNKHSFPLTNFHEHQVQHMEACLNQEGIAFILLKFSAHNRVFLLKAQAFITFWREKETRSKSLPLTYVEKHGIEIPYGINPPLDYIKVIDRLIDNRNKF